VKLFYSAILINEKITAYEGIELLKLFCSANGTWID